MRMFARASKRSSDFSRIAQSGRETFEVISATTPDEVGELFGCEWEVISITNAGRLPVAQSSPPVQHHCPQACVR